MQKDIVELESILALDQPIKSSAMPRWQRKQQQQQSGDRYIPMRSSINDAEAVSFDDAPESADDNEQDAHSKLIEQEMLGGNVSQSRVLAYKAKAPAPKEGYQNSLKVLYSQSGKRNESVKPVRHIPSAPVKVLDAPDMVDDYYLNLLSWSSTNKLAVALSSSVYLWDAASGSISELMNLEDANDYVCSVSWIQEGGSHIAIGTASNAVQLWDVEAQKQVRNLDGHSARVGALAWNNHILSSGSRDTTIINHDVRIQHHAVGVLRQHTQEVCGLAWSPDGAYLASGANDNTLCIWSANDSQSRNAAPAHVLTDHQAAVKALAWCPHERNLLASGGGTADRCIKFWNASSGALLNSVDTGSQVCALQWSPLEKEILSSHGYAENQLCLWKYPTLARMKELKGHTSRVLHMATSPDGSMVCSAAADETLRFWNVFASDSKKKGDSSALVGGANASLQRSGNLRIR